MTDVQKFEIKRLNDKIKELEDEVSKLESQISKQNDSTLDKLIEYIKELNKDLFVYLRPANRNLKDVAEDLERLIR